MALFQFNLCALSPEMYIEFFSSHNLLLCYQDTTAPILGTYNTHCTVMISFFNIFYKFSCFFNPKGIAYFSQHPYSPYDYSVLVYQDKKRPTSKDCRSFCISKYIYSDTYGTNAMNRARLIAVAKFR